jgi:hypothetical protein
VIRLTRPGRRHFDGRRSVVVAAWRHDDLPECCRPAVSAVPFRTAGHARPRSWLRCGGGAPGDRRSAVARRLLRPGRPDHYPEAGTAAEQWQEYLTGIYAVCLRVVTPASIVAKGELTDTIERLITAVRARFNLHHPEAALTGQ